MTSWPCLKVLRLSGLFSSYSAFLLIAIKHDFPVARTIALCGRERALLWDFTWMTSRTADLPCAPPYRLDGCANSRKVTRGGRLEHFLNLSLSKSNLRKSCGSERKTRSKRQAIFLQGVEEVSHQFVPERFKLLRWEMKCLKLLVARKLKERQLLPPRVSRGDFIGFEGTFGLTSALPQVSAPNPRL